VCRVYLQVGRKILSHLYKNLPGYSTRLTLLFGSSFSLLLVALGFLGNVQASIDDGLEAVKRQDYTKAYTEFRALAETGDPEAQFNLAILYKKGNGAMQNKSKAAQWFRKAADHGLADAQYHLARMYDLGDGIEQNFDYAAVWYKKSAKQGNPLAQINLGVLYANGEGVKQDLVLAYVWLNLAASQGLALALDNREILAKSMSEDMLVKVRKISREYFTQFVEPYLTPGTNLRRGMPLHLHPGQTLPATGHIR